MVIYWGVTSTRQVVVRILQHSPPRVNIPLDEGSLADQR